MSDQLDPQIHAALRVELSNERKFASDLLHAARRRRNRKLHVQRVAIALVGAGSATVLTAFAITSLPALSSAQAMCGVGLLLTTCLVALSMESGAVRK